MQPADAANASRCEPRCSNRSSHGALTRARLRARGGAGETQQREPRDGAAAAVVIVAVVDGRRRRGTMPSRVESSSARARAPRLARPKLVDERAVGGVVELDQAVVLAGE